MQTDTDQRTLTAGLASRLADQYTDLLALNWRRRSRLLASPGNEFSDLQAWDERLDAALAALRHLGAAADQHLRKRLAEPISPGEAFAVLAHGLSGQRAELAESATAIVRSLLGQNDLSFALEAALEWSPVSPQWVQTLESLPLPARLRVLASRWRDAPQLLPAAFEALRVAGQPAADVLAAALRCLQYRGDARAAEDARHYLDVDDAGLRLAAACVLLTLCDVQYAGRAVAVLQSLVRDVPAQQEAAARCLALHAPAESLSLLAALQQDLSEGKAPVQRLYLKALGWAGQINAVPRLIEHLDDPACARVAAASLTLLTGSDPVRDGWQGPAQVLPQRPAADATSSAIPPTDPDAGLPWPSKPAFVAHWRMLCQHFSGEHTWFAGRPATAESLRAVLRQGRLPWRPLAAARLQRMTGAPLFPTHLPAPAQAALFRIL